MSFPKIKQPRLPDLIARQLETLILQGVVRPGERLPSERDLAQELNVSRPSLREALHQLEATGWLETKHGGGTFVRTTPVEAIADPLANLFQRHPEAAMDFVELRTTLEGMSAYYAAQRGTEADRVVLSRRFQAMEDAHQIEDPSEEAERDADFHIGIAEASHNIVLLHVMRGLLSVLRHDVTFNRRELYNRPGDRELLLEEHRAVFDAIMASDPERARQAAKMHMTHVAKVLRERQVTEARNIAAEGRLARREGRRKKAIAGEG